MALGPDIPLDDEVVALVVVAELVVPSPVQPPHTRLPPASRLPQKHTREIPPKLCDGQVVSSLPVELPGILDTGVKAPHDDQLVPVSYTHLTLPTTPYV